MAQRQGPPLTRRRFLSSVGLATGALLASPALTSCGPALTSAELARPLAPAGGATGLLAQPITVAVLLPTAHSAAAESLLAGMNLHAGRAPLRPLRLRVEWAGSASQSTAAVAELIARREADLIVAVGDAGLGGALRRTLADQPTPLILAGMGANLPRRGDENPAIVHSTLGLWQASYALGAWAAQNLGRRAVAVSSFYDSGYDRPYAFQLGFESRGGHLARALVSNLPGDTPARLPALLAEVEAAQPELVFAASSGAQAEEFARAYAASSLAGRVPLLASGLLAETPGLAAIAASHTPLFAAVPWAASLSSPASQAFVVDFHAASGRAPDAPALLGYDTACLIHAAHQHAADHNPLRLRQGLAQAAFAGPRGALAVEQGELSGPIYLATLQPHAGRAALIAGETLPPPEPSDPGLAALRDALKTGWTNTYLFS
jgi:branched-chain amino acid transport system substrate-binding protein